MAWAARGLACSNNKSAGLPLDEYSGDADTQCNVKADFDSLTSDPGVNPPSTQEHHGSDGPASGPRNDWLGSRRHSTKEEQEPNQIHRNRRGKAGKATFEH